MQGLHRGSFFGQRRRKPQNFGHKKHKGVQPLRFAIPCAYRRGCIIFVFFVANKSDSEVWLPAGGKDPLYSFGWKAALAPTQVRPLLKSTPCIAPFVSRTNWLTSRGIPVPSPA